MSGEAIISADGVYRYVLTRRVPQALRWVRPVLFVMLNPSTADGDSDDPTIRKCMGFARLWGGTRLTVVNLFALRATDPKALAAHPDPIGPENDRHVEDEIEAHRSTGIVMAAWGAHAFARPRGFQILRRFGPFSCLGLTADGSPRHPLYVRYDQPRVDLDAAVLGADGGAA